MRPLFGFGFGLVIAGIFGGCAMSSETLAPVVPPLDMETVQRDLVLMLAYCQGGQEAAPAIAPLDESRTPEAVYALAETLRAETLAVAEYRGQGCMGENNRGYLELQECAALADAEQKNEAQKALAAVNKTRKALYYELALLYHHAELPVGAIEEIAAESFLEMAAPGARVQLPPVGARFEQFRVTPLGGALGDAAQADAWITIP